MNKKAWLQAALNINFSPHSFYTVDEFLMFKNGTYSFWSFFSPFIYHNLSTVLRVDLA
jgi:hypothetical protein